MLMPSFSGSYRRLIPYLTAAIVIVLAGIAVTLWALEARSTDRAAEEARLRGISQAFAAHADLTMGRYSDLLNRIASFVGREREVPAAQMLSEVILQNPYLVGLRVVEGGRTIAAVERPGSFGALSWPPFHGGYLPPGSTDIHAHTAGLLHLHRYLPNDTVAEMLIDRQALLNAMAPLLDSPGRSVGLFTEDGYTLARVPHVADLSQHRVPPPKLGQDGRHLETRLSPFDGQERLVAWTGMTSQPLLLAATTPLNTVLASWSQSVRHVLIAWAVLALVSIMIAHWFARAMAATDRAVQAMGRSEAELRSVFHQSLHFLALLDTDGRLRRVNRRALTFIGQPEATVTGLMFWNTPWFRDDLSAQRSVREALQAAADGQSVAFTAHHVDTQGAEHVFDVSMSPVVDKRGRTTGLIAEGRDVTTKRQAELRLRALAEQLEDSNRNLEQFAYVASHDLQEPLRMVSSYLGLLRRRKSEQLDAEALEFLEFANDGAVRMSRLITDLLDFSRVTTRGRPFTPVPLEHVLSTALHNLKVAVQESGARISLPEGSYTLTGDEGQLIQLFQNLIGNAIKYADDHRPPQVTVLADDDGQSLRLTVRDNGIGIEPAFRERVFRIFQRLHGRDRFSGTGIGLAIAQRIAERHGGTIEITDAVPGDWSAGSCFVLELPRQPVQMGGLRDDATPSNHGPTPPPAARALAS